jgi:hypothetical protein
VKSYVKKYLTHFGYDISDWIPCECGCGRQGVDIHHLQPRSTAKHLLNHIENLCAVSRECHQRADRDRNFNEELKQKHMKKLLGNKKDNEIIRYL